MPKYLKHLFAASALLFSFSFAFAEIKLPAIIADNMVLQQNSTVKLWGWASAGEKITVTASWNKSTVKTMADNEGRWMLRIKTAKAGGPYTILRIVSTRWRL